MPRKGGHRHAHARKFPPALRAQLMARLDKIQVGIRIGPTVAEHDGPGAVPQFFHAPPQVVPMVVPHEIAAFPVDQVKGFGFIQINIVHAQMPDNPREHVKHEIRRRRPVYHSRIVLDEFPREKVLMNAVPFPDHEILGVLGKYPGSDPRRADPVINADLDPGRQGLDVIKGFFHLHSFDEPAPVARQPPFPHPIIGPTVQHVHQNHDFTVRHQFQ